MHASGTVPRDPSRGRHLLFAALLVAAIVVNVGQFRAADHGVETYWQAIYRYDTADFPEISTAEDPRMRDLYGLYRVLAELAPGSTIYLPRHRSEVVARLYGIGDAKRVRTGGPKWAPAGLDLERFIVASNPGGKRETDVPWAVALDEPDPRPPDLRDPVEFFPAILATDRRGGARGGPREFVLVRWDDADLDPDLDYRLVLMETSLLPPATWDGGKR